MPQIKLGLYQHYKGKKYKVISIAKHSETLEDLVIYQAEYGKKQIWVRPIKNFLEKIIVKNKKIPRFKFIK
ncbi:MAG: DUF1653 domain-containing protein [Patescibacteria group bacterium]|jgi:hypothetical protein